MLHVARSSLVAGVALFVVGLLLAAPLAASTPPSSSVTPSSTVGQTVTATWTGTFPPAVNPTSSCTETGDVTADPHTINLTVPEGLYPDTQVVATFKLDVTGSGDGILTVVAPNGDTFDADDGGENANETILLTNPKAGEYEVQSCAFLGAQPQEYTGTLTLATRAPYVDTRSSCVAPSQPLQFTQDVIDPTRAGGEPIVATHPSGRLLWGSHAGTTHFYGPRAPDEESLAFLENYNGQTYYYFSEDAGKTWEYVPRTLPQSTPESGVPNSGFSDPEFAIDKAGNVFISEINLANIAFSKSSDGGKTYTLQNVKGLVLSDRQWMEADEKDVLYVTANSFGGGSEPNDFGSLAHNMYKSIDGGKTFTAEGEAANPNGQNDIKVDKRNGTLYEITLDGDHLQMARFEGIRGVNTGFKKLVKYGSIAKGVDTLSILSPTFDIDDHGNLYATWDESGQGDRKAGIWYSSSSDGGRTWIDPVRVDRGNKTDIWPWLAVGDDGKVAVTWLQNDIAIPAHDAQDAPEDAGWNVMVGQTLNGLGCGSTAPAGSAAAGGPAKPGFRITQASKAPVHYGTICQGGTLCQAQAIDRRLGDYFANEIDEKGNTYISVSYTATDEDGAGAVALPLVIRQTGGPSFIGQPGGNTGGTGGPGTGGPGTGGPGTGGTGGSGGGSGSGVGNTGGTGGLPATGGGAVMLLGVALIGTAGLLRRKARS